MKKYLAALTFSLYGCTIPVVDGAPTADHFEGLPLNEKLVINGYEGDYKDFPAIGAFVYRGGTVSKCTVSLLSSDLALTAAHCINPEDSNLERLGKDDPEFVLHGRNEVFKEYCENGECKNYIYPVVAAVRHPKYGNLDSENRHDLALLLLGREISYANPIDLLPEAQLSEALQIGNIVTIAGYGQHYDVAFNDINDGKLYAADIPITGYRNEAEIIVGEKDPTKGNGCFGDSGGPIYVYSHGKIQLTGVASRIAEPTDGEWQCGYGLVYGLPTLEKDWIESEYERLRGKYPLILEVMGGGCQVSPTSTTISSESVFVGLLLGLYALRRRRG